MRCLLTTGLLLLVAGTASAAGPRDRMLLTPAQLERELKKPNLVLLHVGDRKGYDEAHIAGARHFDLHWIYGHGGELALELAPIATLDSLFASLGVTPQSHIVIYFGTDWVSPATRVWFTLDYMGLGDRAAILDGGLPRWRAANLPVTVDAPVIVPGKLASTPRPEIVAKADWLKSHLADGQYVVLDARAPVFYRGIESGGYTRPGHIPGARNLYFASTTGDDLRFLPDSALRRLFSDAGVKRGSHIVAYCHIGQQATAVYFSAKLLGYPVQLYDGSFQDWSRRNELPLDVEVPFTKAGLVSTEELASMVGQGKVTLIDTRSDLQAYLTNHIPGAAYLHFESLRAARGGIPGDTLSAETYAGLLGRLGVRRDRPVVVYGSGDAANFNATFLVWLLTGFRHSSVYLLDGGYNKWAGEGKPLSQAYPAVEPGEYSADPYGLEVVNRGRVRFALDNPEYATIVDVRPPDQFSGAAGAQIRRGHIPRAINHFWQDDLRAVGNSKVWKSLDELREGYVRQGITPDKPVILYCNTGTEASHAYFALRHLLGYPEVQVYIPSWTDWAARDDLPIETGASSALKTGS